MTPAELRPALRALAANVRWSWSPRTARLLGQLPSGDPGRPRHPVQVVDGLTDEQLARLADDEAWSAELADALAAQQAEEATAAVSPEIAYFSPEFGLSELIPQYAGGLGVLAGDHLKAASDQGLPLGAVGLWYRQGFFRQELDHAGQAERYESCDPTSVGCVDTGLVVEVPLAGRTVAATIWKLAVGRITLLLLDTDRPDNVPTDRAIADRLYGGDRRHRLEQELVLGVGGARAVATIGWTPRAYHLNEGHAGFLLLELLDRELTGRAPTLDAALAAVRPRVLFTTHTPVPAGIDRFDRPLVEPYLHAWSQRWGIDVAELAALGADPADLDGGVASGPGAFNMAALALRAAGRANAVSALHGEVSRALFAGLTQAPAITAPAITAPAITAPAIISVTNGVHARTWVDPRRQELFDEALGPGWAEGDAEAWSWAPGLDDERLRSVRRAGRADLAALLASRGVPLDPVALDPDVMVIGFARRFATYKRATLLLRQPDLLAALLADDVRPVHLVFAGKAHPADEPGKALLAEVVAYGRTAAANGRFTVVADYDMALARLLCAGCDVWLNTPVRPREASGTSGQKAALNGALNCSIRDGWWDEMSDGRNGWDIPTSADADPAARDDAESRAAHQVLRAVAAEFHADGRGGPSTAWLDRLRDAWATLGPQVTAARMVGDYDRLLYRPMLADLR